jgi:hypothetical protein
MRHSAMRAAAWILSWLAPKDYREPLMGDLAEEYALRARAASSSAAFKWYLRQFFASFLPLVRLRLTQATWISTFGVALLGYIAVGVVDFAVKWAIPNWTEDGTFAPNPLGPIVSFPLVMLIAYFAERWRRRAALVLGVMMLIAITAMTLVMTESAPLWFRVVWFFVGPAGAFIGGALSSLRAR